MNPKPNQSANENADPETAHHAIIAAVDEEATARVAVPTEDGMAALVSIIKDAITLPAKIIQRGKVPVPIIVGIHPPNDEGGQAESFSSLMGMSAMIRMFAGFNEIQLRKAREQTEPFNIRNPKEIGLAFADAAESISNLFGSPGPLSPFYDMETGTTGPLNTSISRADLHKSILNVIFGGLPDKTPHMLQKMDAALTQFVRDIKDYKVQNTEDQSTVQQCVIVNYIKVTDLAGDNSVLTINPYTRMVFIKINTDNWNNALHKPGFLEKNRKIDFTMNYVVTDLKLIERRYKEAKWKWEKAFELIGKGEDDVSEILESGGIEAFGQKTCMLYREP